MLNKITSVIFVFMFLITVCACGDPKNINGTVYQTYGIASEDTDKNEDIEYRMIVGNVVWSVLLCETFVFPIYFVLFSLYEPIGPKDSDRIKGTS